jgi:asparaginyl-tRNA synthetase
MLIDFKDLNEKYIDQEITINAWVKNHRKQKEFGFLDIYDGTKFGTLQVVYDKSHQKWEQIQQIKVGSAVGVSGVVKPGLKDPSKLELVLTDVEVLGDCPDDFPIQPKRHTVEFLREVAYLRPRTNLFQAVFRLRSHLAFAIHNYFNKRGYTYVHTPILTANDGEGAGNTFQVTTLFNNGIPSQIDWSKDFFGKKAFLAVTGQLEGETFAMAFKKIYTFGPTFRAENSNTKTHAAEFWMIEPEIAFCDLDQLMQIEQDFLVEVLKEVMVTAKDEIDFFDKFVEPGVWERLKNTVKGNFPIITYDQAIDLLIQNNHKFTLKAEKGGDIGREHEKFLTEEHFKSPVFVKDWPKDMKAFYMRVNDDGKTVAAVDLLVPNSGELMGGSQREERIDILVERMKQMHIPTDSLDWYINLRKFGGNKHAGFGMGFERLIMFVSGVNNIRDVLPYFRTPNNIDF